MLDWNHPCRGAISRRGHIDPHRSTAVFRRCPIELYRLTFVLRHAIAFFEPNTKIELRLLARVARVRVPPVTYRRRSSRYPYSWSCWHTHSRPASARRWRSAQRTGSAMCALAFHPFSTFGSFHPPYEAFDSSTNYRPGCQIGSKMVGISSHRSHSA